MIVGIVSLFLAVVGLVYLVWVMRFWVGLSRLGPGRAVGSPTVAIIVAARNEEAEIGECLESILAQDYPVEKYEVMVVDDGSTDATPRIVAALAVDHPNLKVIQAGDPPPGMAPKKHAVSRGVEATDSDIIVVTDADCRVRPGWISGLVSHLEPDVGVVVGFTTYRYESGLSRLFYNIQTLEFLSYDFCAAGAIGSGLPMNSNANNLAYRRVVYREVGGFSSGGEYISGDDDLFLQAVAAGSRWRIEYAAEPETYVLTRPTASTGGMVRQRMRWASKWDAYSPAITAFLVSTFVFALGLLFLVPLSLLDPVSRPLPLILFGLKAAADFLVMWRGTRLFGQRGFLRYFPLVELIHVPLILIAALGGQFSTHEWRGRRLSRKI